jgi:hypothetical protein
LPFANICAKIYLVIVYIEVRSAMTGGASMKKFLLILASLIAILLGAGAAEGFSRRNVDNGGSGTVPGLGSGKNRR